MTTDSRVGESIGRGFWQLGKPARQTVGLALCTLLWMSSALGAQEDSSIWSETGSLAKAESPLAENVGIEQYRVLELDAERLDEILEPLRVGDSGHVMLDLPTFGGGLQRFRVTRIEVMQPGLAARFPEILTFAAQSLDDPAITARIDWTPRGLNAMLLGPGSTYFVAPEGPGQAQHIAYDFRELPPPRFSGNDLLHHDGEPAAAPAKHLEKAIPFEVGDEIRLYRVAISAAGEFTQNVGGAGAAMAQIVTFVNQLNALWERDLGQRMVLVDGNEQLIFADPGTDPFVDNPGIFDNSANFDANQILLDTVIGSESYDFGHLMLWNSQGGVAFFSVCQAGNKAKGQTGAAGSLNHLPTLAHEMGHQFYMDHTWSSEVCANVLFPGQHRPLSAYEPGSGNTIMSYAGLCDDGMDDENTGPPIFQYHSHSFDQTLTETVDGIHTCATVIDTGSNSPPNVDAGSDDFTLPHSTPFVLAGSATDDEGDFLTYSWEEYDLPTMPAPPNDGEAPFFRVFEPRFDPERTFPDLFDVITGVPTLGEQLPSNAQSLEMRLVVRDNHLGQGGVAYDQITVDFAAAAGPFAVTAPNSGLVMWEPATVETITWNVASTDLPPVRCSEVDIDLSLDGGQTYPLPLATATPNDGTESITVPNVASSGARVRVRCSLQRDTADTEDVTDHFFFDISDANFIIQPDPTGCVTSLVVSNLGDSGPCTLRATLAAAAPASTITFDAQLAGATITLLSEIELTLTTLTIDGEDREITISGGNTVRLFRLPSAVDITFRNLTLADGFCTGSSPCVDVGGFGDRNGGAVFVSDNTVTTLFERVEFRNNQADFGGAVFNNYGEATYRECTFEGNRGIDGGALYTRSTFNGVSGTRVTSTRTTFSDNLAFDDGGAVFHDDGHFFVYNSTFSRNATDPFVGRQGGAIHTDDRFDTNRVVLELINSTLADNTSAEGGGLYLGVTGATGLATADLTNTLIADSRSGGDCLNAGATVIDGGSNLVEDNSCGFVGGSDPRLGPLENYGGFTRTHPIGPGSPALDNGDDAVCADSEIGGIDQRGYGRPALDCDIGAFEAAGSPPPSAPMVTPGQTFMVDEQAAIGTAVGTVAATDPDVGQTLTYSILDGNLGEAFWIDPDTGDLFVARSQPINPLITTQFQLLVGVLDSGFPPLFDAEIVLVDVNDINRPPEAEEVDLVVSTGANVGSFIGFAVAADPDFGDVLTYSVIAGDPGSNFSIDAATGDLFVADNTGFGTEPSFSLTVQVVDDGTPSFSDTAVIDIDVRDCVPEPGVVSSTADSGPCSLRDTLDDAPSGSRITFAPSLAGATITLLSEIELMGTTLEIDGEDRDITISGGNSVRLFRLPSFADITFRRLTLANGLCNGASPCVQVAGFGDRHGAAVFVRDQTSRTFFDRVIFRDHQADFGGAVFNNYGEARYEGCTFSNNLGIDGGALYARSSFDGANGTKVIIDRTTFETNRATDDGGAVFHDDGHIFAFNSTFSGNFTDPFVDRQGGAIHTDDRFDTDRVVLELINSTFADNSATEGGGLFLGMTGTISVATASLTNTLIADSPTGGDCSNAGAVVFDGGSNLVEDNTCGFTGGSDPMLGPLAENGGPNKTHALLGGSPAIGLGENAICGGPQINGEDQRGFGRDDGTCDIGSFEVGATPPAGGVVIWDGGGVTEDWSEAENWVDDVVPGPADLVIFDGRSTKSSRIDMLSSPAIAGLTIDGFLNLIVLQRDLVIQGDLTLGPLAVLDIGPNALSVEGKVSNEGTLRQTQLVDSLGVPVEFLRLKNGAATETRYYGVDITLTAGTLGLTTVEVRGNQPRCTSSANDDVLSRCYDIEPTSTGLATLRFYYEEQERNGQLANQLRIWHFDDAMSQWEQAGMLYAHSETDLICVEAQGIGCWVETAGINDFSPFVVGSGNIPTAPNSVPVTLSWFESQPTASGVRFRWTTATETANIGFRLYREGVDGLELVGGSLIPSQVLSSFGPAHYEIEIPGASGEVFYLEDVDSRGVARRHGPFALGASRGYRPAPRPIDWPAIHAEHDRAKQRRQGLLRQQIRQAEPDKGIGEVPIRLLVDQDGIYRVYHEDLLAAGFDLTGLESSGLAVLHRGESVPIRIGGGESFGAGSFLELYGEALDTLYTTTNVYYLTFDPGAARRVAEDATAPDTSLPAAEHYLEVAEVDRNRSYFTSAPGADPWYDTWLFAAANPASAEVTFHLDEIAPGGPEAQLDLVLWGVTSWPEELDHHVTASLNGVSIVDTEFDGLVEHLELVEFGPEQLQEGENQLVVTVPNDGGLPWDVVALDRFAVRYPRRFVAKEERLHFESSANRFEISGLPSASTVAYRLDAEGPVLLTGGRAVRGPVIFADGFESGDTSAWGSGNGGSDIEVPGTGRPARYVLAAESAILRPGIEAGRPESDILEGQADYLVISHPTFLEGLAPLVAAREAQGLSVRVVDVEDVYAQLGHGLFGPEAIASYIRHAVESMETRFILLVGGDTYDYHDFLGLGARSFVPSLYAATGELVRWAPVDPLYADVDGDELPDVPLGRLPVRTTAELDNLVQKILDYEAKDYGRTAVFAADGFDGRVDFDLDSDLFASFLPPGWLTQTAYLDELDVEPARLTLLEAIENGTALTTFVGHSASTVWTFDGLLDVADASALANVGRPTVVSQWGCWNTWYVATELDTMAHGFLVSGAGGAASVLGATTLTDSLSERALGQRIMRRLAVPGTTLGEAVQLGKEELAASQPELRDVLLGWTLLGDPALQIDP